MSTDTPHDESLEADEEVALDLSDPAVWEDMLGGPAQSRWLLQDPEVAAVIQRGRPHAVYQAFRKNLSRAPTPQAREALRAVLGNRRYFVAETSAPGMATLNGIGTCVYGSQEEDQADGTYITTLFATFVFLPLWPLRQYLVARAEQGGWYFLGKVPLSTFHRVWRRVVGVGIVALLVWIAAGIWNRETRADVHFVSGLEFPVLVTMGDVKATIQPNVRATIGFASGSYEVVTRRMEGEVLEEKTVEVPGGADLVVYNVLGSAPLLSEVIPYAGEAVDPERAQAAYRSRMLAGASWVTREDVDLPFVDAPENLRIPEGQTIARRTRISVPQGGWRVAVEGLADQGDLKEAADLASLVALLTPASPVAGQVALHYLEAHGDDDATEAFVAQVLAESPDSIQAHRLYQGHMKSSGRTAEILPRYRKAHEAEPDSVQHGYLYARILPLADALRVAEPLLASHPDDPWLLRVVAWAHYHSGHFEQALPHYEKSVVLRPEEAGVVLPYLARALVGAGRPEDAFAAVSAFLDAAPDRLSRGEDPVAGGEVWDLMTLYVRLQALVPEPLRGLDQAERWRVLLQSDVEPYVLAGTAARAGLTKQVDALRSAIEDRQQLRYCDMTLITRTNVEGAARLALDLPDEELLQLEGTTLLSIACELHRTGHRDRAESLLQALAPFGYRGLTMELLDALPDVADLPEELTPEIRALMLYAASRRTTDAQARDALVREARHFDVLGMVLPNP